MSVLEYKTCPECGAEVIVNYDSPEEMEYCCDYCPFCGQAEDFVKEGDE